MQQDEAGVKRAQEESHRGQASCERAESVHEVAHLGATRLSSVLKARPNLVAQQDIDEAEGRDRVAEAQVSTAKATLASAREQLALAKASQDKTRRCSPMRRSRRRFAGVITHRYADTRRHDSGGHVLTNAGHAVGALSQNSRLRLVIPAGAGIRGLAHPSWRVGGRERAGASHKTFTGTIARFRRSARQPSHATMHAEVDVPNANLELVPGMYADASIVLDQDAARRFSTPVEALDRKRPVRASVCVNRDHRVRAACGDTGLEDGDRVEIGVGTGRPTIWSSSAIVRNAGRGTGACRRRPLRPARRVD